MTNKICPLCNRIIPKDKESEHHLIPKCYGGKKEDTIELHKICHKQIHMLIPLKDLAKKYNSLAKLKKFPEMKKFLKWIKNKPPEFYPKTKQRKNRDNFHDKRIIRRKRKNIDKRFR